MEKGAGSTVGGRGWKCPFFLIPLSYLTSPTDTNDAYNSPVGQFNAASRWATWGSAEKREIAKIKKSQLGARRSLNNESI